MFYEKISKEQLQAMTRADGITPSYTYEEYITVKDETGKIIEAYYLNLTIHKTADEVYEEWLKNSEASKISPLSTEGRLAELEAIINSPSNLQLTANYVDDEYNKILNDERMM